MVQQARKIVLASPRARSSTKTTRPIGDWKEAWEKAKQRAGAILSGKTEEEESRTTTVPVP